MRSEVKVSSKVDPSRVADHVHLDLPWETHSVGLDYYAALYRKTGTTLEKAFYSLK